MCPLRGRISPAAGQANVFGDAKDDHPPLIDQSQQVATTDAIRSMSTDKYFEFMASLDFGPEYQSAGKKLIDMYKATNEVDAGHETTAQEYIRWLGGGGGSTHGWRQRLPGIQPRQKDGRSARSRV